jgi:hypothetical protein
MTKNGLCRPGVDDSEIADAFSSVKSKLAMRISQYGRGIFISRHEVMGIVDEEIYELHDAVRDGEFSGIRDELVDVAVAAIWGIVSIDKGKMNW